MVEASAAVVRSVAGNRRAHRRARSVLPRGGAARVECADRCACAWLRGSCRESQLQRLRSGTHDLPRRSARMARRRARRCGGRRRGAAELRSVDRRMDGGASEGRAQMKTIRLTMAQALVRFLAAQRTVVDGREVPLLAGVWAIFGHGNVAGLGEALYRHRAELPTYRAHNEQAMAHAAIAYAKAQFRRRMMAGHTYIGPGATAV